MKFTKNKFTMMTGTLLLTLALTACGSASENEPTDGGNSSADVQEINNNGDGGSIEHLDDGVEVDDSGDQLIRAED